MQGGYPVRRKVTGTDDARQDRCDDISKSGYIIVRIDETIFTDRGVKVTALVNRGVVPEDARGEAQRVAEFPESLQFVRLVAGLVIHVELAVLVHTRSVIVISGTLIRQFVVAIDVL